MTDPVAAAPARLAPPLTLRAAAAIVVIQTVGECIAVGWTEGRTWPLRIALMVVLGSQILFAFGALRFSAGSTFVLFACQLMAVAGAIAAQDLVWLRVLFALSAIAAFGLLAASLGAFPEPDIRISRGPR